MNIALPVSMVIFSTIIGAIGAFMIKKGISKEKKGIELIKDKHLILGIILYAASPIINIIAFKFGSLIVLYPLITFTYIWSSILAVRYLKENMNIYKISGITLIIISAFLVVQ